MEDVLDCGNTGTNAGDLENDDLVEKTCKATQFSQSSHGFGNTWRVEHCIRDVSLAVALLSGIASYAIEGTGTYTFGDNGAFDLATAVITQASVDFVTVKMVSVLEGNPTRKATTVARRLT